MNANAEKWVAALESGEYKQAHGALAPCRGDEPEGYCCLGVACEVALKEGLPIARKIDTLVSGPRQGLHYNETGTILPEVVRRWLGMKDASGLLPTEDSALTVLNDHGASFERIAEMIRQHEDELFE